MKFFTFRHFLLLVWYPLFAAVLPCMAEEDSLAADRKYSYLGVFGGYGYVLNTTSLQVLPGASDCGAFADGKSGGLLAGITYDYTILPRLLQLSGRVYYASRPADLTTQTSAYEVFDNSSNTYKTLVQEFSFQSSLNYLVIDVGAKVFPMWPFYIRASVDAGNPMFSNTYKQYETIVEPEGALFPDGTRRRLMFSGELTNASTSLGVTGGIGADIEFQPRWFIAPEVSFRQGIGSILREGEWKMAIIQAGIGIKYEMGHPPPPPPVDTTPPPPPPPPPPPRPPPPPPPPPPRWNADAVFDPLWDCPLVTSPRANEVTSPPRISRFCLLKFIIHLSFGHCCRSSVKRFD